MTVPAAGSDLVVLFDIDGTLIDHDGAEVRAVGLLQKRLRIAGAAAAFHGRWRVAFDRHYARHLAGELTVIEQRRERLRDVVDPALSDGAADHLIGEYLVDYVECCSVYDDVKPTLAALSGYRLGIISNSELSQQRSKLERNGIHDRFETFVMSVNCGIAKPEAGIFHLACRSMGVAPEQAVYIGDRLDLDAEGARRAGLAGIWLDREARPEDEEPRTRIRSLASLPAALRLLEHDRA